MKNEHLESKKPQLSLRPQRGMHPSSIDKGSFQLIRYRRMKRSKLRLFSHYLADDFSTSTAGVEIDQDNLLPGTQCQCLVAEGHGQGRSQH